MDIRTLGWLRNRRCPVRRRADCAVRRAGHDAGGGGSPSPLVWASPPSGCGRAKPGSGASRRPHTRRLPAGAKLGAGSCANSPASGEPCSGRGWNGPPSRPSPPRPPRPRRRRLRPRPSRGPSPFSRRRRRSVGRASADDRRRYRTSSTCPMCSTCSLSSASASLVLVDLFGEVRLLVLVQRRCGRRRPAPAAPWPGRASSPARRGRW